MYIYLYIYIDQRWETFLLLEVILQNYLRKMRNHFKSVSVFLIFDAKKR